MSTTKEDLDGTYYKINIEKKEVERVRWCDCDPEITATLMRDNPPLFSTLGCGTTLATLDQFFKLLPEIRKKYRGIFFIPSFVIGGAGYLIADRAIRHPKKTESPKRVFLAFVEGIGAVFIFLMGEAIQIYCKAENHTNPEGECSVDAVPFWTKFFSPTFAAGLLYSFWNSLSPDALEEWSSDSRCKQYFVQGTHFIFRTLLFSRFFQALILTINPSISNLSYFNFITVPGAAAAIITQRVKPHYEERINTVVRYIFNCIIGKLSIDDLQDEFDLSPWSLTFSLKFAAYLIYLAGGTIETIYYSRHFVTETIKTITYNQVNDNDILAKAKIIKKQNKNHELSMHLLDEVNQEQKTFREEQEKIESGTLKEISLNDNNNQNLNPPMQTNVDQNSNKVVQNSNKTDEVKEPTNPPLLTLYDITQSSSNKIISETTPPTPPSESSQNKNKKNGWLSRCGNCTIQ